MDTLERKELRVGDELREAVDDGRREVVVEWDLHLGRQVAFEVNGIGNSGKSGTGVQGGHLLDVSESTVENRNCLCRYPSLGQVGFSRYLSGNDSEMRPGFDEVGPSSRVCVEGSKQLKSVCDNPFSEGRLEPVSRINVNPTAAVNFKG